MTQEKLIENANKIGAKVNLDYDGQIGIQFKSPRYSGLWHWFKIYTFLSGENEIVFTHSYSQNTGATKKGLYHGMKVKQRLGFYEEI